MTFSLADQRGSSFGGRNEESGLRRVLSRIFRERELIIRSDGQVRFLRIGPRVQMAATGILVAGAVWAATAVPVTVTQGRIINTNRQQIVEAKLAYEDLIAEVAGYQSTVSNVSAALRESRTVLTAQIAEIEDAERKLAKAGQSMAGPRAALANARETLTAQLEELNAALAGVTGDGEDLENMVAKIRADLAAGDDGRTLVARARARLQERADALEVRLASVISRNEDVEGHNNALTENLEATTEERDNLAARRAELESNVEALNKQIAILEEERAKLQQSNSSLTLDLESTRSEVAALITERHGLQEQVAALDNELQLNRTEQFAYRDDLRDVATNLQSVIGDATQLEESRLPLRAQIDGLLAELNNQQAAEELVLQRATERAASNVQEIEKVVAMTGLDVERLLQRIQSSDLGQGGPFVAASSELPAEDELGQTMLNLDSNMSRWEALKEILRVLPLSLPVDYYHMTSDYGPRTDPVNGRRSMHYGVDMAGWMKSSIWAAAPGTVVYSGVKGRYGYVVEIDHGFGIRTRYAHLNKTLVKVGDVVGHRQRVALLGSSGRSTGPHLHYEVLFDGKPLDPMNFIKAGRYVFKN